MSSDDVCFRFLATLDGPRRLEWKPMLHMFLGWMCDQNKKRELENVEGSFKRQKIVQAKMYGIFSGRWGESFWLAVNGTAPEVGVARLFWST